MDNQQGEYDYLIGTEVGVRSSSGEEIDRKVIINSYKCVGDDTVFLCSDGKMYEEDELNLRWKVGPSGIMMIWFSENWTAFDAILKNIVKPVGVCMSFIKVLIDYGYVKVDSDNSLPEDKIDKINTIGDSLITDWLNENRTVIENIIIELRSIDDMHDYWCDEYNELFDKFMKKLEDNNILRFKKADDEPVLNHPWCTAIKRTNISVPTRYLLKHNLVHGRVLDYGCGHGFDTDELSRQGYDITGYDNYYRPERPDGLYDTIICNYVLNVLEPEKQTDVLDDIKNLLAPEGNAYIAVRRDIVEEGYRLHAIHRQYTYQCNVIMPYESLVHNKQYEIYKITK